MILFMRLCYSFHVSLIFIYMRARKKSKKEKSRIHRVTKPIEEVSIVIESSLFHAHQPNNIQDKNHKTHNYEKRRIGQIAG